MVRKKSVLIIGEVESQNLGDQAIYYSLKSEFSQRGYDVVGECLSCKPSRKGTITLQLPKSKMKLMHSHLYSTFRIYTKIFNLLTHLKNRRKRAQILESVIAKYDFVIIGGGQLLQNNNWSFPLDLHLVAMVLEKLKKPVFIIGCGVGGKNWDFLSKFCMNKLFKLRLLKKILVRDLQSVKNLRFNFNIEADFIPDPAVTLSDHLKIPCAGKPILSKIGIGVISPSMLRRNKHMEGYSHNDHLNFWTELITNLAQKNYIPCLFTTGDRSDYIFAEEIKRRCSERSSIQVELYSNPESLEELTRQMLTFTKIVSMRLHSHIIAYSYDIPSYGIIWDNKVEGFASYTASSFAFTNILDTQFFISLLESKTLIDRVPISEIKKSIKCCIDKIS